ncbi:unnamed protein product [Cylicocyclus nassatus]|uniref:SET domain-containing protein n=1 Tax=Cylicocyclus nassatus TaxID=53992 RepID=A0AA36GUQ2_CYLNA|nr:unnamed protein product [Cylicocyclus nassatus]
MDRKTIEQPTSAFFLGYNGEPIRRGNVQRLLKRFLDNSGLGTLRISCNTSRHDAARIQYERFFSASYQEYSPVDKDCAVLEGHRPRTQLLNYNDNYIMACATAYHKLQVFADEEAREYAERVDRACRMVHIADLGLNETVEDDTSESSPSSSDDDDDDDEASAREKHRSPLAKRRRSQRETSPSTKDEPAHESPEYMECSSAGSPMSLPAFADESTQRSRSADASEEVCRENIDDISRILQRFNKRTYDGGLSRLETNYEKKEFFRRRDAKPVQDYPWLEVRELPAPVNGRGIFAKVDIPKSYVVCDYRGKELHWDDADRRLNALGSEDQKIVESYMVEYNFHIRAIHFHHAILAHAPTYKGTVVLGRLINHSALHPNLAIEVTSMRQEILQPLVYFRTIRKVKAGEQLLWDYGPKFGRNLPCICNNCRPDVLADSTATLRPSTYPVISAAIWSELPSLSQQVIAGGGLRAPLSVSDVLVAAAHRAGAAALIEESAGTNAMAAYEKSRRVVLGTSETIAGALSMPPGVTSLYHLLCAAHFDAFALGNPTIITIRKNRRDFRPLVLLFGSALPAESTKRYGSCVTYVATEDSTYAVDYQRSATAQRDSLDVEYRAGTLICLPEVEDDLWDRILKASKDPRSLTRLLLSQQRYIDNLSTSL